MTGVSREIPASFGVGIGVVIPHSFSREIGEAVKVVVVKVLVTGDCMMVIQW